ncbi:Transposon Ty3-I Gag-Pol polyprotein [Smittium culicis]|uniref:Transposon Ty3-I Gag-Pol polyprotein n=1 Tax=Smittium culicis TaxID=133412 RepID=A0A1R1XUI4_9FUNG|nr:Transposon Ty3-I Gag-Pol polyprotein [Smittium culicis]
MSRPGKKPNTAEEWDGLPKEQQRLMELKKAADRGMEINPDDIDRVVEEASRTPRPPTTTPHEKRMWLLIDTVTKNLKEISRNKRLDPFFRDLMTQRARHGDPARTEEHLATPSKPPPHFRDEAAKDFSSETFNYLKGSEWRLPKPKIYRGDYLDNLVQFKQDMEDYWHYNFPRIPSRFKVKMLREFLGGLALVLYDGMAETERSLTDIWNSLDNQSDHDEKAVWAFEKLISYKILVAPRLIGPDKEFFLLRTVPNKARVKLVPFKDMGLLWKKLEEVVEAEDRNDVVKFAQTSTSTSRSSRVISAGSEPHQGNLPPPRSNFHSIKPPSSNRPFNSHKTVDFKYRNYKSTNMIQVNDDKHLMEDWIKIGGKSFRYMIDTGAQISLINKTVAEKPENWDCYLWRALLAMRTTKNRSLGRSPAEIVYGLKLLTPAVWGSQEESNTDSIDTILENRKKFLELELPSYRQLAYDLGVKSKEIEARYYNKKVKSRKIKVGDKVLKALIEANTGLSYKNVGPFIVMKDLNDGTYEIVDDRNNTDRVHADRLIQYQSEWGQVPRVQTGQARSTLPSLLRPLSRF